MHFLRYPTNYKGYKLYDLTAHKVFISKDATFFESVFPFKKSTPNVSFDKSGVSFPIITCSCERNEGTLSSSSIDLTALESCHVDYLPSQQNYDVLSHLRCISTQNKKLPI